MLMKELPRERLLIAVQAAATMEAAFEFTREYVRERKAFGRTIVSKNLKRHFTMNLLNFLKSDGISLLFKNEIPTDFNFF